MVKFVNPSTNQVIQCCLHHYDWSSSDHLYPPPSFDQNGLPPKSGHPHLGMFLAASLSLSTYVYLSTKFTYLSYHSLHEYFYPVYLLNLSFAPSRPKYHNCQKIAKMVKNSQNGQKLSQNISTYNQFTYWIYHLLHLHKIS